MDLLIYKICCTCVLGIIICALVGIATEFHYLILNRILFIIAGLSVSSFIVGLLIKIWA